MSVEEDLRRIANEPADDSKYSSEKLAEILQIHSGNLNLAAAQIWQEKAAVYSALVDMQEGETKRNLSDMMKNALEMAKVCQASADTGDTGVHQTTTSRILRP